MRAALGLLLTVLGALPCIGADTYPSRVVRVVSTFGPGSTPDLVARVISQQLSEQLGKPFVVENRVGATGAIGTTFVAKSAPDGYTLLIASSAMTLTASLYKSPPYDVLRDFVAISSIMRVPEVIVVPASLKINTLKEFVALLRANPGKFNYGSSGTGGLIHLSAELFKKIAKVDITHVPYNDGAGAVVTAMLGNQVQLLITSAATVQTYVRSGQLRALAVTTAGNQREPTMPDVPSMSEAGLPGMEIYAWWGLVAPAGTPSEVVNKVYGEVRKAVAAPAVKDKFATQGGELAVSTPEEFAAYLRGDVQRWTEVVKSAGITLDQHPDQSR